MNHINKNSMLGLLAEKAQKADGRLDQGKRHSMYAIVALLLVGYLCGYSSYRGIYYFFCPDQALKEGNKKELNSQHSETSCNSRWYNDKEDAIKKAEEKAARNLAILRCYIDLPNGIPHYSTFSRALANADSEEILILMYFFFSALIPVDVLRQLSMDGKADRAAISKKATGKNYYIVNICDVYSKMMITSFPVGDKTNEAKALAKHLPDLLLGCRFVVTTDAMGTTKEIIQQIVDLGSDYFLPLKNNNKNIKEYTEKLIFNAIESLKDKIDHTTDFEYNDNIKVAGIILGTRSTVVDEDNAKYNDDNVQNEHSIETHSFFDKLYTYKDIDDLNHFHTDIIDEESIKTYAMKDNEVYLVKIDSKLVPMRYVHGRLERREVEAISLENNYTKAPVATGFESAKVAALVTRYRGEIVHKKKKTFWNITVSRTPYIGTDESWTANQALSFSLQHWTVERTHNILDEHFREDRCTTHTGDAPVILSALRKAALNISSLVASGWTKEHPDNDTFETNLYKVFCSTKNNIDRALLYLNTPFNWGTANPL